MCARSKWPARWRNGTHVTVATPFPPEISADRCTLVEYSFDRPSDLKLLAEQSAVLVVQGFTLSQFPFLGELKVAIVVDLYCPFTIEHLEMVRSRRKGLAASPAELVAFDADAADVLNVQNTQLALGDFFLCASERQRDFWIGALHTAGRINPQTYAADPTLRSLIDVVPFGLPDAAAPEQSRPAGGDERRAQRHPARAITFSCGPDRFSIGRIPRRWCAPLR